MYNRYWISILFTILIFGSSTVRGGCRTITTDILFGYGLSLGDYHYLKQEKMHKSADQKDSTNRIYQRSNESIMLGGGQEEQTETTTSKGRDSQDRQRGGYITTEQRESKTTAGECGGGEQTSQKNIENPRGGFYGDHIKSRNGGTSSIASGSVLTDKTGDEELNNNQVDKIVIHHTVTDSIEYDEYFKNRSNGESLSQLGSYVYYHFIVASDGTKIKHRELEEYSRATRKNNGGIHIAMQGDFTDHPPTLDQLVSVREIIDEVRGLYGDLQVYEHGELEGEHTACAGKSFDTSMLSREYIENLKNPPVVAAKEKDLGIYGMTRYYTPVPGQAKYYNKTYEAEYNMNCMGNCRSTASGYRLEEKDVGKILACPPNLKFGDVLRLEYSRGSIYATCQDRGGAIKGKRLDIWSGIGQAGYNNIFVNGSVPSGPARVYLQL